MRYVKKPDEIEAYRCGFDKKPHWMTGIDEAMIAPAGYYIVKDSKSGISACKPDVFEKTYSKIMES